MANLHGINRRIKSVTSTKQITSTMQMISAAKVPKCQKRLQSNIPYNKGLKKILSSVCSSNINAKNSLLLSHKSIKNNLIIVITSDKGLAGGFNSKILQIAQNIIDENKKQNINTCVISCGKKATIYCKWRGIDTKFNYVGRSENPSFKQAKEISDYITKQFVKGNIDKVNIIYNKCKNSLEQEQESETLLPFNFNNDKEAQDENNNNQNNKEYQSEFVFEPSEEYIISKLIPMYIRCYIYNKLIDSACGEQVARRVAMQAATDSANDMIETLTRQYNTLRQGAITTELTEIVGGADALDEN